MSLFIRPGVTTYFFAGFLFAFILRSLNRKMILLKLTFFSIVLAIAFPVISTLIQFAIHHYHFSIILKLLDIGPYYDVFFMIITCFALITFIGGGLGLMTQSLIQKYAYPKSKTSSLGDSILPSHYHRTPHSNLGDRDGES